MLSLSLFFKVVLIWLVIALLAIANGGLRDLTFTPLIGRNLALPLSGLSLSIIVLVVTYFGLGFFGKLTEKICWLIGLQWVLMTLAFEFLFGHYVAGKSWAELLQTFNILQGDLFLLVLLISLVSPRLLAKYKGLV
jgi:hypothetical protein